MRESPHSATVHQARYQRSTDRRASHHNGRQNRRPLVLVVDDEPGIVEFLRYALEDNGYRVATARDGLDALSQIMQEQPNFVLTDLMMPRLDGWELSRRLREDDATHSLPLIGMSAVDARQAPLDAFLRKPFELDELLDTLARLEYA